MNGKPYTRRQLAILRRQFADTPTKALAEQLGHSTFSVSGMAHKLGLHKNPAYRAKNGFQKGSQIGAEYRYKPGNVPANTGTRRPGYAPGRMGETQFKKGVSLNRMPLGSTRLVGGYVYRKTSEIPNVTWTHNWTVEHHLVWIEAGRKPINFHTHALIFKDGNRENTELSNLKRITRKQNMRRNSIHLLPEELKEVIRLKGAINRQITYKERRRSSGEEQAQRPA